MKFSTCARAAVRFQLLLPFAIDCRADSSQLSKALNCLESEESVLSSESNRPIYSSRETERAARGTAHGSRSQTPSAVEKKAVI